jgi:hypothetical protein
VRVAVGAHGAFDVGDGDGAEDNVPSPNPLRAFRLPSVLLPSIYAFKNSL